MSFILLAVIVMLVIVSLQSTDSTHVTFSPIDFKNEILDDDRVWIVKFYSPMCGACTEFNPTWMKLENSLKSMVTTTVNIDQKDGMDLAQKLGVLDEGLPNIRLFTNDKNKNGISILKGDSGIKIKALVEAIKDNVKGLRKRDDGFYIKA